MLIFFKTETDGLIYYHIKQVITFFYFEICRFVLRRSIKDLYRIAFFYVWSLFSGFFFIFKEKSHFRGLLSKSCIEIVDSRTGKNGFRMFKKPYNLESKRAIARQSIRRQQTGGRLETLLA